MGLTKVTYSMIEGAVINVLDYGADPTGTDDSTSQIGAAIDAGIASGNAVYIPAGTYKFDGYTNTSTNAVEVSIIGDEDEPTLIPSQAAVNAGNYMFLFNSTTYSQVTGLTLPAAILPGQTTIQLTSVTGLSAGMVIQISSNKLWYNGSRGTKRCGEIHLINSVDVGTNTITIDDYVRDSYNPSLNTLTIRAWNPSKITIKNLRLEAPYPATVVTSVGIYIQQAHNSIIENVKTKGFIQRCFTDKLSINSVYRDIECLQDADMPTATTGYGVSSDGSLGLLIDGFKSTGQRRAFDADNASDDSTTIAAVSRDWQVTNFIVRGGGAWYPATAETSYGIGMHGPSENGYICNGFISDVTNGVNARGRSTTVDNVLFGGDILNCNLVYEEGAGLTVKNCTYDSFAYPNKTSLKVYSIIVAAGGSGYLTAPTVTISAPPSGTTATATAVLTGDAVTSVTITVAGSGYTEVPTVTFTSGSGSGAVAYAVMDFVEDVRSVTGTEYFVKCGIGNTDSDVCYYDIPIVIENNVVKGCYGSFIITYENTTDSNPYIENLYISNNQVESIADPATTFEFMTAGASGTTLVNGEVKNNTIKLITGVYARWFDTDYVVGGRKTNNSYVNFKFEDHYYVTIGDDSVIMLPLVSKSSDRVLVEVMERNSTGYIFYVTPNTANIYSVVDIANTPSYVDITATGAALTGTTGTDGLLTFGLTSVPQNLYVQNRTGSQKSYKIRVS